MSFLSDTKTPHGHPLFAWAKAVSDYVETRRGQRQIAALDDHLKRDIGISDENIRSGQIPSSRDVSDALYRASLSQFRPWL